MFLRKKRCAAKRCLAYPAVFVLLWQMTFPAVAWAGAQEQASVSPPQSQTVADQANGTQPQQETAVSLEKAISVVRDNFTIPQEYTQFSSGLNMFNQSQTWSLTWSSPDQPGGSFSAQVDAETGDILNMNNWKNSYKPSPTVQIPAIQANQAKDIAVKLVTRLAAGKLSELQLMPMDNTVVPLSNYGPVSYRVHWLRSVDGIPFPNNGVEVQVNAENGEIQSYSLNWTSLTKVPAATGVIALSKAEESFLSSPMLELQYFTPSPIRPLTSGEKQGVKLVYQLNPTYLGGAIDALTGEPIKASEGGYYGYGKGGFGQMPGNVVPSTGARTELTPAEQAEIDKSAKLISRDEAVAVVSRWLSLPDDLVLRNSSLGSNGMSGENPVWNLNWSGKKTSMQPQYISARVDAVTGELLGFNLPYPSGGKAVIDRTQAQAIAEDFIKQIEPGHVQDISLSAQNVPVGIEAPDAGPQNFNYYRLVNGIPFRNNGIDIMVDPVSKKIINYNFNWSKLDFPAASGILDAKEAGGAFLKAEPLKLVYTTVFNPADANSPGKVRLVYQPTPTADNGPGSSIMDAQTGEFLDWQGQPVSQTQKAYHFTDISTSFAQKQIALLGQAGIFGEYQNEFHPDEQITLGSLLKAMLAVSNGYGGPVPGLQNDTDVIKTAEQQGWITGDPQPGATITREDFTKLMIRYLKLEPLAKLQDIYQVPYSDVDKSFEGYAALAKGIGMFNISGEKFEPGHIMTRAEAAYGLVSALMFRS